MACATKDVQSTWPSTEQVKIIRLKIEMQRFIRYKRSQEEREKALQAPQDAAKRSCMISINVSPARSQRLLLRTDEDLVNIR